MFRKKGVLRKFAKFTGKLLSQSLFFIKVAALLNKRLLHRYFPMSFVKFLRIPFYATSPVAASREAANFVSSRKQPHVPSHYNF